MTKKTLFLLAGGSLVLFSVAGWVIMKFFGPVELAEVLQFGLYLPLQILLGLILGLFIGLLAWWLIDRPYFNETREFFVDIIGQFRLSWLEVILVSCCAGIGEEILFRGAVQPFLGIGWTSFLFVLLHGYINPFNQSLTVYGIFMVLAVSVLGYAAFQWGLVMAMVAHTVIDIVLLHKLTVAYGKKRDTGMEMIDDL